VRYIRRRALAPFLVASCVLLDGCTKKSPSKEAPHAKTPAWSVVTNGIDVNGGWSKDAALRAFALAVAPLPGVDVPPADDSVPDCSVPVIAAIAPHLASLTPEQRKIVTESFVPPRTLPVRNAVFYAAGVTVQPAFEEALQATRTFFNRPLRVDVVVDVAPRLPGRLGRFGGSTTSWCPRPGVAQTDPLAPEQRCAVAFEQGCGAQPPAQCACKITLHPPVGDGVASLLAHELTHCYEMESFTGPAWDFNRDPKTAWYLEGYASWVEWKLYPARVQSKWRFLNYLEGGENEQGRYFSVFFTPY
jgi:hypothetical protein